MSKEAGDCTGLGKWFFWVIVALVLGGTIARAIKASGQGVGTGAFLPATVTSQPVQQPVAVSLTVVPSPCDGDTSPSTDTSDGWIIAPALLTDLGPGQIFIGTSGGAGTSNSPISLAAALAYTSGTISSSPANKRKLYLRGGTYGGRFTVVMVGSSANPWIIQPCPGETAVLNQRSTANAAGVTTYHVQFLSGPSGAAKFVQLRNLEFTDKDYTPTFVSPNDDTQDSTLGNGYHGGIKVDNCSDITFENCVIHDQTGSGILVGSTDVRNLTIKGCLFYNIGAQGRGKHHGVYLDNEFYATGSLHIVSGNTFINCAGYGIQLYTSAPGIPVSGIYCTNNIIRDSSGEAANMKSAVIIWDDHPGVSVGTDIRFVDNVVSQLGSPQFISLRNETAALIYGNYFQLGASKFMFRGTWTGAKFRTNTVVSINTDGMTAESAVGATAQFDFNTYKMSDATPFLNVATPRTFAQWQSDTGRDASSTWTATTNSGTVIKYVPNLLDTNLVYFAILNEDATSTVDIDLTPYWPAACGTYEIRNAGNYEGTLASSGAWTGQSAITITMTGQSYANAWYSGSPNWVESPTFFAGIAKRIRAH